MAKTASTAELRKMTPADLRKEIEGQRADVAKMKMAVMARSQKDTAKYRREKKEVARMMTVLREIDTVAQKSPVTALKPKRKVSKVPASKPSKSTTPST